MQGPAQTPTPSPPPPAWVVRLVDLLDMHARTLIVVALAMLGLSAWLSLTRLDMKGDRNAMFKTDAPYHRDLMAYKREFGADDDSIVLITGPKIEDNHRAARMLGDLVRADSAHFDNVYDCLDTTFVRRRLLFYLSARELRALHRTLEQAMPFLQDVLRHPGLGPFLAHVNRQVQRIVAEQTAAQIAAIRAGVAPSRPAADPRSLAVIASALPLLNRVMSDMGASLRDSFTYSSPWAGALATGAGKNADLLRNLGREVYLDFQGGLTVLVLVRPKLDDTLNTVPGVAAAVRAMVKRVQAQVPNLEVTLTGKAMLESDEIDTASRDSEVATLLSLFGVVALFLMAYRHLGRPALALCCLLAALAWTVGFATLTIGHLNVLTVTVMPMLVGLGIDFGIQVITRYEEERVDGRSPRPAMVATLAGTGGSIVTAGVTTAASFQAVWLTRFAAIQELGFLAAAGIALSVLAMLIFLPALLLLADRRHQDDHTEGLRWGRLQTLASLERGLLAHPWGVLLVGTLFTVFCWTQFDRVRFDANVLHLQAPEVIALTRRLEAHSDRGLLCAEVVVDNLEAARLRERQLQALPSVLRVESLVPLLPEDQQARLPLVRAVHRTVRRLPSIPKVPADVQPRLLHDVVHQLRAVGLLAYPFVRMAGPAPLAAGLRDFVHVSDCLLERIRFVPRNVASQRLQAYQVSLFGDLFEKLALMREADSTEPMRLADLPRILRSTFVGRTGKWLLHVFPKENIWDRGALHRFLTEVRTVDPHATGTPVEIYESTGLMMERYPQAARLALAVIVVVVLLQFRAVVPTLLVLLPLFVGLVWMVGMQGVFDVEYNPANFLAFSLILGVGVANGIYIVQRYQEEGSAAVFDVSTGRAILLSNLTAIMGFASLMVAHHHGLYSLGVVMSIGIASCMASSLILLPAVLQILAWRGIRL